MFLILLGVAHADTAYWYGNGATLRLLEGSDIEMVSEDVDIDIAGRGAHYRCRFILRNVSTGAASFQVGWRLRPRSQTHGALDQRRPKKL